MAKQVEPTPEDVQGLWAFMRKTFGTRVVQKVDAGAMRVVSAALGAMGIVNARDFMTRFATTIGRTIYVPFVPGDETTGATGWDLWQQMLTCAHEHQHVVQLDRDGKVRFGFEYLRKKAARARYEAEARTTEVELHFWRFGAIPNLERLVEGLSSYALRPADITAALSTLRSNAEAIRRGAVLTQAGHAAISWLEEHARHLKSTARA
jgi:hypothetical protein